MKFRIFTRMQKIGLWIGFVLCWIMPAILTIMEWNWDKNGYFGIIQIMTPSWYVGLYFTYLAVFLLYIGPVTLAITVFLFVVTNELFGFYKEQKNNKKKDEEDERRIYN